MDQEKIDELDKKIDELTKNVAVISTTMKEQGKNLNRMEGTLEKVVDVIQDVAVYIERTNENDKKIDKLFELYNGIYNDGVKQCPVNMQRIDTLEKKTAMTNKYIFGMVVFVVTEFIYLLIFIALHHPVPIPH